MEKIKLTDKQKDIIYLMRNGWNLHRYIRYWHMKSDNDSKSVNGNSAYFLIRKGIIFGTDADDSNRIYQLTELGKTIEL